MNLSQKEKEALLVEFSRLIEVMKNMSCGDSDGPRGFEALCMTLAGEGTPGHSSVKDGLDSIAESLNSVAEGLQSISDSINNKIL